MHGTPDVLARGVTAHLGSGADHVAVQLLTDRGDDPVPGYRALAEALLG